MVRKEDQKKLFDFLHPGQIEFTVKMANERSIKVIIDPSLPISSLKAKIEEQMGIAASEQRLLYKGFLLDTSQTVSKYGVRHDDTVLLGAYGIC